MASKKAVIGDLRKSHRTPVPTYKVAQNHPRELIERPRLPQDNSQRQESVLTDSTRSVSEWTASSTPAPQPLHRETAIQASSDHLPPCTGLSTSPAYIYDEPRTSIEGSMAPPPRPVLEQRTGSPAASERSSAGPTGREGVKRGQYDPIDKEDETKLFKLCYKDRALYKGDGLGSGVHGFFRRITDQFNLIYKRDVSFSTVRKRVDEATNKYIVQVEEHILGEEEEDTQWLQALATWAIYVMDVRKNVQEKQKVKEKRNREL